MTTPPRRLKYSGLEEVGHLWEAKDRGGNGVGGNKGGGLREGGRVMGVGGGEREGRVFHQEESKVFSIS